MPSSQLEHELEALRHLARNPQVSQRVLAAEQGTRSGQQIDTLKREIIRG